MRTFSGKLLVGIGLILGAQSTPLSAAISVVRFEVVLDGGYEINGHLSYDDSFPTVIAQGPLVNGTEFGENIGVESLSVNILHSSGVVLGNYLNVLEGEIFYNFLALEFDTSSMNFVGLLDIGEDTLASSPDEYFLTAEDSNSGQATPVATFQLNSVLPHDPADPGPIDQSQTAGLIVSVVPEASICGCLGLASLLLLMKRTRRS